MENNIIKTKRIILKMYSEGKYKQDGKNARFLRRDLCHRCGCSVGELHEIRKACKIHYCYRGRKIYVCIPTSEISAFREELGRGVWRE